LYNTSTELIKEELNNSIIKPIYNIFEDSMKVYSELISEKKETFKGIYFNEFKGRLINYIIKRFFDKDLVPKNFPFIVNSVGMAFGQKRTELRSNNIILTIGKAENTNTLPCISSYKRKLAMGNSYINRQIKLNFDGEVEKYSEAPFYGIIAYKINDNKIDFINIVIPDSKYEYVVEYIPLTPSLKIVAIEETEDEDDERVLNRQNIKAEILENINNIELERGHTN
jgi:hypothetical protein